MSPERDQNRVTLEEIISNAKEIMVRDGNHLPTLILEASKSLVVGKIPDLPPTHGERVELMRFLGQAAAKSGRVDQIQQIFMVTEGWMSVASEDKPPEIQPSQDPNRKEVLIITAIQIKERKKHMKVFEILRDSTKQVSVLTNSCQMKRKEGMSRLKFPYWMPLSKDFRLRSEQNTIDHYFSALLIFSQRRRYNKKSRNSERRECLRRD